MIYLLSQEPRETRFGHAGKLKRPRARTTLGSIRLRRKMA